MVSTTVYCIFNELILFMGMSFSFGVEKCIESILYCSFIKTLHNKNSARARKRVNQTFKTWYFNRKSVGCLNLKQLLLYEYVILENVF